MSLSDTTTNLASRLTALAQRLGLSGRVPRMVFERSRNLQLPFQQLPAPTDTIWWQAGPPLPRRVDLPRVIEERFGKQNGKGAETMQSAVGDMVESDPQFASKLQSQLKRIKP